MVFFEKIDGVPHFERKLVGLQFFTGDSGHENLRSGNPYISIVGQASWLASKKRSTIAY
jgi:hypothetical protein